MPGIVAHLIGASLLVCLAPICSNADSDTPVIKCYQCHSKYDDHCKHISVNSSVYFKPCEDIGKYAGQKPFCRKIAQKIHGWESKEVMVRKCGWVKHNEECYRVRNWDHSETVCQCFTDGCNFGTALHGSLFLLLLPLLIHVCMA
ncbi:uncharacterized protein LOC128990633 [Macrosteles quadrilineatus]|uniref:uncharacterized protein LOC128990633 n=1 Tax=Macrosteles quadrilineatus TaxID=74068 RepID=UPI0023E1C054|nr:uncharacterized protein LOC128990633 [Macrosteles quadrilineatus]